MNMCSISEEPLIWKPQRMKYIFYFVIQLAFLIQDSSGACTYPASLSGVFYSSSDGFLTWNTTTFGSYTIITQSQTFTNIAYDCYLTSGNLYVGRSASFNVFTVPFYAYTCLELHKKTDNLYYYYYATTELAGANGVRVMILPVSTTVTSVSTICDATTPYPDGSFSILYKNGSDITQSASTCPSTIQGYFTYTINDGSTTYCVNNSYVDVCSNTTKLNYDYLECNVTTAMYSAGGQLHCLHSETVSTTSYVVMYNADPTVDNVATFRTVCMVLDRSAGSNVVYATQYPLQCQNSTTQSSTSVTTPGSTIVFTIKSICPVLAEDYTVIIVVVIVVILLVAGIIVGVILLVRYKKKMKISENSEKGSNKPDAHPPNYGENNSRTLFTPTGKIPNGSSTVSDGQVVLSARTQDTVDGESLADEYGEIEADEIVMVSESTAGSLPIFSEGGSTPKRTQVTPPGVVNEHWGQSQRNTKK